MHVVTKTREFEIETSPTTALCVIAELFFTYRLGEAPTERYPNSELGNPGTPDRAELTGLNITEISGDSFELRPEQAPELFTWASSALLETIDHADCVDWLFYHFEESELRQ